MELYLELIAPAPLRERVRVDLVSVVGDFCAWDGRFYQMRRLGDSVRGVAVERRSLESHLGHAHRLRPLARFLLNGLQELQGGTKNAAAENDLLGIEDAIRLAAAIPQY